MAPVQKENPTPKDSLTAGLVVKKEDVYSKVDTGQKVILSPKARELAGKRLEEIDREDAVWAEKTQIPVKGDGRPPLNQETIDSAMKAGYFRLLEKELYKAALAEKTVLEISKCKEEIKRVGREWKDLEYAKSILERFDRIVMER